MASDRGPTCVLTLSDDAPAHYLYVDNVGVVGHRKELVEKALGGGCACLEAAGLATHEVEVTAGSTEVLGGELSSKTCLLTPPK